VIIKEVPLYSKNSPHFLPFRNRNWSIKPYDNPSIFSVSDNTVGRWDGVASIVIDLFEKLNTSRFEFFKLFGCDFGWGLCGHFGLLFQKFSTFL